MLNYETVCRHCFEFLHLQDIARYLTLRAFSSRGTRAGLTDSWTNRETGRGRDRQGDRGGDRQGDRQRGRQAEGETAQAA